jgi:TBC1 domain family member 5
VRRSQNLAGLVLTPSSRWIRLLFGREFEFKDVLRLWDVLFAESLRGDIVDLTCVAMLLRSRWALIDADYTTAITSLTHYSLPGPSEDPRSLVRDAIRLDKQRGTQTGSDVVQEHTGRRPKQVDAPRPRNDSATPSTRTPQRRQSPVASPRRLLPQQKQLEGLFRDVTGSLQKRAEGWEVSKAVRSAVGEVKRNMSSYQTAHSRQASTDIPRVVEPQQDVTAQQVRKQLQLLQDRNVVLARMLDEALTSLRGVKLAEGDGANEDFNISLARLQFVSVYLSDPDMAIAPPEYPENVSPRVSLEKADTDVPEKHDAKAAADASKVVDVSTQPAQDSALKATSPPQRPSLMDASFSFMLGENRHRSSFVSSVTDPPEQKRGSDASAKPKKKVAETKTQKVPARLGSESEDDGFDLTRIGGGALAGQS